MLPPSYNYTYTHIYYHIISYIYSYIQIYAISIPHQQIQNQSHIFIPPLLVSDNAVTNSQCFHLPTTTNIHIYIITLYHIYIHIYNYIHIESIIVPAPQIQFQSRLFVHSLILSSNDVSMQSYINTKNKIGVFNIIYQYITQLLLSQLLCIH